MRGLILVIISTFACVHSSFAANSNCAIAAEVAAFNLARPQGNKTGSSVFAAVENSKLIKQSGLALYYSVQIGFDVTSGYSDSFPPEIYSVTASGSEYKCKIVSVKLNK